MPSLTVENYLKAILQIGLRESAEWVSAGQVAQALGVSTGTVTTMHKTLGEADLVVYRPYEGVCLTEAGQMLGMRVLRRHRLIEQFLVETLGLSWDQVHEEAEHMEHAVSDDLVDRIDEFLGRPRFDPHGDPIPTATGTWPETVESATTLASCPPGSTVRVVRVTEQGAEFLQFLTHNGVALGVEGRVVSNNSSAGTVTLEIDGAAVSLGGQEAAQLLVDRL
ncbi:MAG TPA: metal-dependent transcriptional regulator [Planctomycetaceae bacterium]|jgi:DtxR family Mn-dependent transcriptional regulator|nr:metal-dependent transcriptional regulator [Planctomycetales bacterium]GIS58052.1 MAG: transcriptional regulator [Planctomycetaceae bacterium]GIT29312.1 MAG: transcriptional regulator [Planctomycetaceae bacterium]HAA62224.1 metal-dependent transcriptional regulator [Planctomycetaceae bacterium]|tara:strand:- start:1582 stop:2247 length:666 start_codon:yes stop_codon:yes gene_type:complete